MNERSSSMMYETTPIVSELNKVPGFNPLKFLRRTENGPKLDLKYKKLWFRLKYPTGRTKLTALRITEQMAIIEAKVYFDKNDTEPRSSYISTKKLEDVPGGLYLEAAQHEAMDVALSDAGFGVQFLPSKPKDAVALTGPAALEKATPAVSDAITSQTEAVVKEQPAVEAAIPAPVEAATPATAPQEMPAVDETTGEVMEAAVGQTEEASEPAAENAVRYTADMTVEEICAVMSLEDAGNIIVPVGTCKNWTLSQVAERRPASLKWYLNGYNGDDNILRAGAKLLLEALEAVAKAG